MIEVSLAESETRPASRKGSYGHPPKVWKCDAQRRGEVYSLLNEAQNVMTIVGRAVPWSSQIKNREKSCERIYFPVCSHLTREGTGSKGLMVTRMKKPWNAGLLFFMSLNNIPIGIFFLNISIFMRTIPKRQNGV